MKQYDAYKALKMLGGKAAFRDILKQVKANQPELAGVYSENYLYSECNLTLHRLKRAGYIGRKNKDAHWFIIADFPEREIVRIKKGRVERVTIVG